MAQRSRSTCMRRPAIVICPGGGYEFLSTREAEPVALHFLAEGFNCFVVWYRHAPHRYPRPQQDVAAAVAYVRTHADELHTDPNAIAVMGFSAGGHAAGSLGVSWHRGELWEEMGLTPEMVRPNAMVLCYPVVTGGEYAHRGSFVALTGSRDVRDHLAYSLDTQVTPNCPPTFLWHTFTDKDVPVQNSLMLGRRLCAKQASTPNCASIPSAGMVCPSPPIRSVSATISPPSIRISVHGAPSRQDSLKRRLRVNNLKTHAKRKTESAP